MIPDIETRTGIRIVAALNRIQSHAGLMGRAAEWHIGKASHLLENPALLEFPRFLEVDCDTTLYLARLPELLAETEQQDLLCHQLWTARHEPHRDSSRFAVERAKLARLFPRFQFHGKLYERLIRQDDKPALREAIHHVSAGTESTPEAIAIEDAVRMTLHDFVNLERQLAEDLADLDAARGELATAHEWFAKQLAQSHSPSDPAVLASAKIGLQRASTYYDYREGFGFTSYAQHWIKEAIQKRRGAKPDSGKDLQ